MKKISEIAAVESKAAFQEQLLEKFVQHNLPLKVKKINKIDGMRDFSYRYKEIESCAAETPVNGTVEIFFEATYRQIQKRLSVPATSRFFVFFTRDEGSNYKVVCSSSLS